MKFTPLILSVLTAVSVLSVSSVNAESDSKTSLGLGIGHPYGGLGANLAYEVTPMWNLTAGLGLTAFGQDVGWAFGSRIYPIADSDFRLSGLYGITRSIERTDCYGSCTSITETFASFTLGAGWGARAGESGWDVDAFAILTSGGYDKRVDELEDEGYSLENESESDVAFLLSFGYHWSL